MERRSERRARERQERKAQNRTQPQGRHEISRRNLLIFGGVGAAGIAVAAIVGRDQLFEESSTTPDSASYRPKSLLTEVPESVFRPQAEKAVDDFARIFRLDLDKQQLRDNIVYADLSRMTAPETAEFCSRVPCYEAEGYTGGSTNHNDEEEKIYILKHQIDRVHQEQISLNPNVAATKPDTLNEVIKTQIRKDVFHELVHFTGRRRYPVSPQLDEMFRRYATSAHPELADPEQYQPQEVSGFRITYKKVNGTGGAGLFRGLEEAIAINGALYASKLTTPDRRFLVEDKTYYYDQTLLFADLISKLPGVSLQSILAMRLKPGSLDELINIVGKRFESDPNKQYERGFQILFSIDGNKKDLYQQYTQSK